MGTGFQLSHDPAAGDRGVSLLCCSVLDDMLFCESPLTLSCANKIFSNALWFTPLDPESYFLCPSIILELLLFLSCFLTFHCFFWLSSSGFLDKVDESLTLPSAGAGAELWCFVFICFINLYVWANWAQRFTYLLRPVLWEFWIMFSKCEQNKAAFLWSKLLKWDRLILTRLCVWSRYVQFMSSFDHMPI